VLGVVLIGLAAFVVLELVLRLIFPAPRLRKEPQVQIALDARMGYRTKPNQTAFEMDAPVSINKLGFRGPDFEPERQPGSLRILGLGNSITFGSGLADDETYLARLEEKLRAAHPGQVVEVLNAAMEGFTIRQYLPFLERVLPKVKPDVVILGAAFRDLHFHPRMGQLKGKVDEEAWKAVKKKFDQTNNKVVHIDRAPFKERLSRRTKNGVRRWRTAYVAYYLAEKLRNRIAPPSFIQWQTSFLSGEETEPIRARRVETKKTLAMMKDLCVDHGAKLAFIAFPIYDQILRDYPQSTWPEILAEACKHHGLPYLDLLPALRGEFSKDGRAIFLPYDGNHYSASCHDSMSVAVYDFLKSARLVPEDTASRAGVSR
jgi:lysophospholipase L1-like esterase